MTKNPCLLQTLFRTVVVELDVTVLPLDPKVLYELPDHSARAVTIIVAAGPILIIYPFVRRCSIPGIMLGAISG